MKKVYTIFSEILKLCPRYHFEKAVKEYHGDRYVKTFTTWQQFMAILYSQITQKDSLRDIVTGLSAHASRWYHRNSDPSINEKIRPDEIFRSYFNRKKKMKNYLIFMLIWPLKNTHEKKFRHSCDMKKNQGPTKLCKSLIYMVGAT